MENPSQATRSAAVAPAETPALTARMAPAGLSMQELMAMKLPAPYGKSTDDLDGMLKRRNIRAIVLLNATGFFYSKGHPMGVMYEALREFEKYVNHRRKTGKPPVTVSFIPLRPDQAEAALVQGVGDLVAYPVVVTKEREQSIAFSVPLQTGVKQIVVAGPDYGPLSSVQGLSGKEIYVSPITVAYQRLLQINDQFKKQGKTPITITPSDPNLMEDDIIEMVNAGLVPATVTTTTRAKLWAQVLKDLTVHENVVLGDAETTAWALRKDNPQLKHLMDEFIAPRAVGTSFGNTLLRRYLENTKWVRNSRSPEEMKKFDSLVEYFKKYAGQYGFDYLMIIAQGYQESRLDQSKRGPGGSVGIMQVIPRYAAAAPINVPDVTKAPGNIEAAVKMLRNIEDQYFNDPGLDPMDKTMMAFASYNAGPVRIAQSRREASEQGLDPNKWFDNVELMVAKDVGQETVNYVRNIYKYYVAYWMALEKQAPRPVAAEGK
jgi:membrane-bound lytic murein transglycosylase MltF